MSTSKINVHMYRVAKSENYVYMTKKNGIVKGWCVLVVGCKFLVSCGILFHNGFLFDIANSRVS